MDNEIVTVISILSVDLTCYLVLPTNNNNNYNNDSSQTVVRRKYQDKQTEIPHQTTLLFQFPRTDLIQSVSRKPRGEKYSV